MSPRVELEQQFRNLPDEELMARGSSGDLTDLAQEVANAEARSRGLQFKPRRVVSDDPVTLPSVYHGVMQTVARPMTPTEARLLVSTLQADGVPAEAVDTNRGGTCVRVPAAFVTEAHELIAAFKRGDFALGKDFDVPV
jgi:hypothetical protein